MTDDVTVLHVDDETAYADLQQMYLEKVVDQPLSTITTTDAGAVLNRIDERSVDCVVCDYDMPDVDGLEVLGMVRDVHPTLPFILLTGKGNENVASEALRLGATDYVQKPSGSKQYRMLGNRIWNAVSRYRRQQADQRALEQHQRTIDRIAEPIFAVDEELRIRHGNEATATLLEGTVESLPGTPLGDCLHGADELEAELVRALDERTPGTVRFSFDGDGSEAVLNVYPDDDGLSVLVLDAEVYDAADSS